MGFSCSFGWNLWTRRSKPLKFSKYLCLIWYLRNLISTFTANRGFTWSNYICNYSLLSIYRILIFKIRISWLWSYQCCYIGQTKSPTVDSVKWKKWLGKWRGFICIPMSGCLKWRGTAFELHNFEPWQIPLFIGRYDDPFKVAVI